MRQANIGITDESQDRKYFTIVPNYILNHSTANDQALYLQMKRAAGENGMCYITQKHLCERLGIGKIKLQKSLEYLIKHKWIAFIGTTESKTKPINTYKVNDIWKLNTEYYQEQKISSESAQSPNQQKDKSQISTKKSPRTAYIRRTNVKEEHKNTVEAEASVNRKIVDNSGDNPRESVLKEPYNRTPNGNCSGCTDPDPLGGTHCEGTYQHPLPEKPRGSVTAIGDVLKKHQIKKEDKDQRITHEFQAEALRYWQELGLKGTPPRNFFRHIQLAYKNGKQGRLQTALSYCKDAQNIRDREKLFYWRFANEPGKAGAKTHDL